MMHRDFLHGAVGSNEVVKRGEIFKHVSSWSSDTFCGTYRGTVVAAGTGSGVPEGYGDYEGDNSNAGLAYSGEWRDGVPRGTGWWQQKNEKIRYGDETKRIYAGEFHISRPCGQGAYWVWGRSGLRCFEGKWQGWRAQGIM